jgi:hypothetical protein
MKGLYTELILGSLTDFCLNSMSGTAFREHYT